MIYARGHKVSNDNISMRVDIKFLMIILVCAWT